MDMIRSNRCGQELRRYMWLLVALGGCIIVLQLNNLRSMIIWTLKGMPNELHGKHTCVDGQKDHTRFVTRLKQESRNRDISGFAFVVVNRSASTGLVGICHINKNKKEYYPLFLRPAQLYLRPLPVWRSQYKIKQVVTRRKISRIAVVVNEDELSRNLGKELISLMKGAFRFEEYSQEIEVNANRVRIYYGYRK
jgi:hypothetical protein